jgi:hypothetical protein
MDLPIFSYFYFSHPVPQPVGVLREFAAGFGWALALNRVLRLAGTLSITKAPKSTG